MADSTPSRRSLTDEQLLALSYEDLCDSDYQNKIYTDLTNTFHDQITETKESWMHTPFIPEDIFNFGGDYALARELSRRRLMLEMRQSVPPEGSSGRLVYIFGHIARIALSVQTAVAPPPQAPLPRRGELHLSAMCVESVLQMTQLDISKSFRLSKLESTFASLLDILRQSRDLMAMYSPRFANVLTSRFARSFAASNETKDVLAVYENLKLAAACCRSLVSLGIISSNQGFLMVSLCHLFALRSRGHELLDEFDTNKIRIALNSAEGSVSEEVRQKRKLAEAKMLGKSPVSVAEMLCERDEDLAMGQKGWRPLPERPVVSSAGSASSSSSSSTRLKQLPHSQTATSGAASKAGKQLQTSGLPRTKAAASGNTSIGEASSAVPVDPQQDRVRAVLNKIIQLSTRVPDDLRGLCEGELGSVRGGAIEAHIISAAASEVHTCGQNSYGELGHCDVDQRRSFAKVDTFDRRVVVGVGAGNEHSVFVTQTGDVVVCGYNDNGQCGIGSTAQVRQPSELAPIVAEADNDSVIGVAVNNGCEHTLLLTREGKVYSFGYNYRGQLGLGHTASEPVPRLIVALSGFKVISAACSYHHSFTLSTDGSLHAFGRNDSGQLGLGDVTDRRVPTLVSEAPKEIMSLSCGQFHTVLVTRLGEAFVMGKNEYGQLMLEGVDLVKTPTLVRRGSSLSGSDPIVKACCGYYHTLLLTQSGKVFAAGRNDYGQLGLGHNQPRVYGLSRVDSLAEKSVVDIACGCYHSVAITFSGMIYVFGRNNHGQLGTGDSEEKHAPVAVDTFLGRQIVSISAGFYHTIVLSVKKDELRVRAQSLDQSIGCLVDDDQQRTSTKANMISLAMHSLERRVGSLKEDKDGNTDCSPFTLRMVRQHLNSASFLMNLVFEHLVLPLRDKLVFHLLSQSEGVSLLIRLLRALPTVLHQCKPFLLPEENVDTHQIIIEDVTVHEERYLGSLREHMQSMIFPEAEQDRSNHLNSEYLAIIRSDLLMLLNFGYEGDLASPSKQITDGVVMCLASELDVLFPSELQRSDLLKALSSYIKKSIADEVMLVNENKRSHLCRCVFLIQRIASRFGSTPFIGSLLQRHRDLGVDQCAHLLEASTEIYRILSTFALRRLFSEEQLTGLRAALSFLDQINSNFIKIAAPAMLRKEEMITSEKSFVLSIYNLATESIVIILSQLTGGSSVDEVLVIQRAGPVLSSILPKFLLFGADCCSTMNSGLCLLLLDLTDALLTRLTALRVERKGLLWVEKLLRLMVDFCASSAAALVGSTIASSTIESLAIWSYLQPFSEVLDYQPVSTASRTTDDVINQIAVCEELRSAQTKQDPAYRLLIQSIRSGTTFQTVANIENIVFTCLRRLTMQNELRESTLWNYVCKFTKKLFSLRARVAVSWMEMLTETHSIVSNCCHLLTSNACPSIHSRLLSSKRSKLSTRFQRVLRLVQCVIRWRAILQNKVKTKALAVLSLMDTLLINLVVENDAVVSVQSAEAAWRKAFQPLVATMQRRRWQIAALQIMIRFYDNAFDREIYRTEFSEALLRHSSTVKSLEDDRFVSAFLRQSKLDASADYFIALLACASETASRILLGTKERDMLDIRLLKSILRLLSPIFYMPAPHSAQVMMMAVTSFLFQMQALIALFIELSTELNIGAIRGVHNRISARDNFKTMRSLVDAFISLVGEWALSAPQQTANQLLSTTVFLLTYLSTKYIGAMNSVGELIAEDTAICGEDQRIQGHKSKRYQELIHLPIQFSKDKEGLVIQGEKLQTNFKGIDYSLALWVHISKKPSGHCSFITGKVSHTDAWPVLLLRADLKFEVLYGKGGDFERFNSKAVIAVGQWVHICVVIEPRKIRLYINGVHDNSVNTSGNTRATLYPIIIGSCPILVRTRVEHVRDGVDGLLSNFHYHTRALSPAYVKFIFEQGQPESSDYKEGWGYRMLTSVRNLLDKNFFPIQHVEHLAGVVLKLLLQCSGRISCLASDILFMLLTKGDINDISIEASKDTRLSLLGLEVPSEAATATSIMRINNVSEVPSFPEKFILLFIRLIGCCWHPGILSCLSSTTSNQYSCDYVIEKDLFGLISFAPGYLARTVMTSMLGVVNGLSLKQSECFLAHLIQFGSTLTNLLRRLSFNQSWGVTVSGMIAVLARSSSSETREWRGTALVDALGLSALIGMKAPSLSLGGLASSFYSGSPVKVLSINSTTSHATVLARSSTTGYRLITQRLHELEIPDDDADSCLISPLPNQCLQYIFQLLNSLMPFVQLITSDLFATATSDHSFVRSNLLRGARPVELFIYENVLAYLVESPMKYDDVLDRDLEHQLLHISLRTTRLHSSTSQPSHFNLMKSWSACCSTTSLSLGSPISDHTQASSGSEKIFSDFVSRHVHVASETFKTNQLEYLRLGNFSELIYEASLPNSAVENAVTLNFQLKHSPQNDLKISLSETQYMQLFSLVSTLRHLIITLSRRYLLRLLDHSFHAKDSFDKCRHVLFLHELHQLGCGEAKYLSAKERKAAGRLAKKMLTLGGDEALISLPSSLRYMALSFFRNTSTDLKNSGLIENTDIFTRIILTGNAWLEFLQENHSDGEMHHCLNILKVILPSLYFTRHCSSELPLMKLVSRALESAIVRAFDGEVIPRELLDLARSNAYNQIRRRAQELLAAEQGRASTGVSELARCSAQISAGLELLMWRHQDSSVLRLEELEMGNVPRVPITNIPRIISIGATSIEIDLSPCYQSLTHCACFVEVALGVVIPGEETHFESIYRGCGTHLVESALAPDCSYAIRCRYSSKANQRDVHEWSPSLEFGTPSGASFAFDENRCGSDIFLSADGSSASHTSDDSWSTVLGNRSFSSGQVSWEIRILQSSTAYIFVGVAKSSSDLNTFLGGDEYSWGFIGEQALYHSREKVQVYGESFSKGDVVGVSLDFTAGTLSFSRNGKTLGVGFSGVYGELFPAVAFYNAGQQVEVVLDSFRTSVPQEPIPISPTRISLSDLCLIRDILSGLNSKAGFSPITYELLCSSCNLWCTEVQTRCKASSGRQVLILKKSTQLDQFHLRYGDRVRTPFGLATVIGWANGRLWLRMGDSEEVWFFSRVQVIQGQESGLFTRAKYQCEDKQKQLEPKFVFEVTSLREVMESGKWTHAMDAELLRTLTQLADSISKSVWEVGVDDIHREFRMIQQPLIRLVMRDSNLCSVWGIKGPSRRAVVVRCGLFRFLNHTLQRCLPFLLDREMHSSTSGSTMGKVFDELPPLVATFKVSQSFDEQRLPSTYEGTKPFFIWQRDFDRKGKFSQSIPAIRHLVFLESKQSFFAEQLLRSGGKAAKTDDEYDYPEDLPQVKLNRFKSFRAFESSEKSGEGTEQLVFASLFGQLWRELRAHPVNSYSINYTHPMDDGQSRAFKVKFEGEGVDDYGGPYRDVFQILCEELQRVRGGHTNEDLAESSDSKRTSFLPLLVPTANWTAGECEERYKFTFNPNFNSAVGMDFFLFLGQFVGIAMRSKITLDLALPSFIWKVVLQEILTEEDLRSFDMTFYNFIAHLSELNIKIKGGNGSDAATQKQAVLDAQDLLQDLSWTITSMSGASVDLIDTERNNVEVEELDLYLEKAVRWKLCESASQIQMFRQGILDVVPSSAIAMLSWWELEALVCGSKVVDVKRLQENTEYDDDVSSSDPHILFFWAVLETFKEEDKNAFLRFVWARPTLPPKGVAFPQKMRIQSVSEESNGDADAYLPKAHTCFFSINLPRYSSKMIMEEKLRYAITNCTEMDADYKLTDGEDVVGWNVDQSSWTMQH